MLIFINFLIGTIGSLVIFLVASFLSAEKQFSAPFFVVAIGIITAVLSAVFDSYILTWIVLGIYTLFSAIMVIKDEV